MSSQTRTGSGLSWNDFSPSFRGDGRHQWRAHTPLFFNRDLFVVEPFPLRPKRLYGAARFAFGEIEFMINIKGFA